MPLEEADSGSHWATRVFGALSLKLSGGRPLSLFLFSHLRIYLLLIYSVTLQELLYSRHCSRPTGVVQRRSFSSLYIYQRIT